MHFTPTIAKNFRSRARWMDQSIRVALILSLVLVALSPVDSTAAKPHPVSHVVIIWLKRPGNQHDQDVLIRASKAFRRIRGVIRVEAGRGMEVGRQGIEQPFDVGVVITFRDQAALEEFGKNRRHLLAVREVLRPLAKRYIVYNSLVE